MALKTIWFIVAFLCLSFVEADLSLSCSSDADCVFSGYHCCHGSIYCCPDGYICTGTLTCISIGVIVGPIVGAIVLIVSCVVCCVCYRRRRNRLPATVAYGQQQQVVVNQGQQNMSYGQPQAYGQPPAYPQSAPVKY